MYGKLLLGYSANIYPALMLTRNARDLSLEKIAALGNRAYTQYLLWAMGVPRE